MRYLAALRSKSLLFLAGCLALVSGAACVLEPSTAVNEVGTEHTVRMTVVGETLQDLLFAGNEVAVGEVQVQPLVRFRVISGPNAGKESDEDCVPSCSDPDENYQISWTYQSNGVAGTDTIEACVIPGLDLALIPEGLSELEQTLDALAISLPAPYNGEAVLLVNTYLPQLVTEWENEGPEAAAKLLNDFFNTRFEDLEDLQCETAEKTWAEPIKTVVPTRVARPNIGAGLSGLFQGQPTPFPTAPAASPAQGPSTQVIRPPSTGQAGLK